MKVLMCSIRKRGLKEFGDRIDKGWKYFHPLRLRPRPPVLAKRFLINLMLPVLFCVMVKRGMTVAKNGRSFPFPAWVVVGKTSLTSYFLANGWKYICDDLTVMDRAGIIHHFPIPLHIYRYHKKVYPAMIASIKQAMTAKERSLRHFAIKLNRFLLMFPKK